MRCTFKTVFYINGSKERNGIVPIMGRVTINGTIAQFSCKQSVTKAIWDAKGNRAIGKSKEAKEVNFALDNINLRCQFSVRCAWRYLGYASCSSALADIGGWLPVLPVPSPPL